MKIGRAVGVTINPHLLKRRYGLCKNRNWDRHDAEEWLRRSPDTLTDSVLLVFDVFGVYHALISRFFASVQP
jgi:hypothetical protein